MTIKNPKSESRNPKLHHLPAFRIGFAALFRVSIFVFFVLAPPSRASLLTVSNDGGASNVTENAATLWGELLSTNGGGLIVTNTITLSNLVAGTKVILSNTAAQFRKWSFTSNSLPSSTRFAYLASATDTNGLTNAPDWNYFSTLTGSMLTNYPTGSTNYLVIVNTNDQTVAIFLDGVPLAANSWNLATAIVNALSNTWSAAASVVNSMTNLWSGFASSSTNDFQTLHFKRWGSDTFGTGWQFLPYRTLGKAYSVARTLSPSITNQILCLGGAGTFIESSNLVMDTEYVNVGGAPGGSTVIGFSGTATNLYAAGFGTPSLNGKLHLAAGTHNGQPYYTNVVGLVTGFFYYTGAPAFGWDGNTDSNGSMQDDNAVDLFTVTSNTLFGVWLDVGNGGGNPGVVSSSIGIMRVVGNSTVENITLINTSSVPVYSEAWYYTNCILKDVNFVCPGGVAIGAQCGDASGLNVSPANVGITLVRGGHLTASYLNCVSNGIADANGILDIYDKDFRKVAIVNCQLATTATNGVTINSSETAVNNPNVVTGCIILADNTYDGPDVGSVGVSGRWYIEGGLICAHTLLRGMHDTYVDGVHMDGGSAQCYAINGAYNLNISGGSWAVANPSNAVKNIDGTCALNGVTIESFNPYVLLGPALYANSFNCIANGVPFHTAVVTMTLSGTTGAGGLITNYFPAGTVPISGTFNPTNSALIWAKADSWKTNCIVFRVFTNSANCSACAVTGPATITQ